MWIFHELWNVRSIREAKKSLDFLGEKEKQRYNK